MYLAIYISVRRERSKTVRAENISARTGSKDTAPKAAKSTRQNLRVLAIPYYSQLVRSNGGLEHIYFRLMVDPMTGEYSKPKLCVWNPKETPSLPDWLAKQEVEAVLCSDNRPGFEGLFSATGITLFWNQRGEIDEMVTQWLRSLPFEGYTKGHQVAFA